MSDFYLNIVHDDILQFLFQRLTEEQLRLLESKDDVLHHIDEETENEIRDHIWDILWSYIRWGYIVRMVREHIRPEEDEEEKSQSQSSDDEYD